MFAKPRARKLAAAPPRKRKAAHSIDEITFDGGSRAEYLTGFHKRKQQRIKHAQEIAAEKERKDRIEFRKQVREERKQRLEEHVRKVREILRESGVPGLAGGGEEGGAASGSDAGWDGIRDDDDDEAPPALGPADHEEEYLDEDRYTTVTVEAVAIDREGMHKPGGEPGAGGEGEGGARARAAAAPRDGAGEPGAEKERAPKKKKKKFRYESKADRQVTERKNRAANRFKGTR